MLLTAFAPAAHAQDKAQLPYSVVSSYLELFKSLQHLELITPSMMITSSNPKVAPETIEFKVMTSSGWQAFNPDEYGVIKFPDNPAWAKKVLISNQPKGTLQLVVSYGAKPVTSTSISYQDLMSLVPQFDEALTALANMSDQAGPEVKGLTVQLPEGSGAAIHVLAKNGKKTLKPYSTGVVVMKYNKALWQENPPVEFDQLPIGIMPLL